MRKVREAVMSRCEDEGEGRVDEMAFRQELSSRYGIEGRVGKARRGQCSYGDRTGSSS